MNPFMLHSSYTKRTPRQTVVGPAQKGLMQKFITTRSKIITDKNNNNLDKNGPIVADALINNGQSPIKLAGPFLHYNQSVFASPHIGAIKESPKIERDSDGKLIRRGYIPVKERIQNELKDLHNREAELKRMRKLSTRQSQPDLLASINNENVTQTSIDDDLERVIKKLKSSLNISDDAVDSNTKTSIKKKSTGSYYRTFSETKRRSLPLLSSSSSEDEGSDSDSREKHLTSHQLIAKWENLIKQNSKRDF